MFAKKSRRLTRGESTFGEQDFSGKNFSTQIGQGRVFGVLGVE